MTLDELIETLVELRETVAAFDQPQPQPSVGVVDTAPEPGVVLEGGPTVEVAGDTPSPGVVAEAEPVPSPAPSPSPDNVQATPPPASPRVVVLTQVPGVNSLVCVPVENIWPVQLLKVLNPIGQFTPGVEELHGAFEPTKFNEALDNIERDQLAIMLC